MKKVLFVIGARPNYIKSLPLIIKLKKSKKIKSFVLHSGQHYDDEMFSDFLKKIRFPKIDFQLKIPKKIKSSSARMAELMKNFKFFFSKYKFDAVIVFGDVNTTVAASLNAKKFDLPLFHVESGLRSFDPRTPEELNRIIVDNLSDLLFTTEKSANSNLLFEGIEKNKIKFVGNLMIENLINFKKFFHKYLKKIKDKEIILITFHRSENIVNSELMEKILEICFRLSNRYTIIWPLHPVNKSIIISKYLTKKRILKCNKDFIKFLKPLNYIKFISYIILSKCIISDSGGVQEEATFLKKRIITFRDFTERPITVKSGYNKLLRIKDLNYENVTSYINAKIKKKFNFEKWDKKVSYRIEKEIMNFLNNKLS